MKPVLSFFLPCSLCRCWALAEMLHSNLSLDPDAWCPNAYEQTHASNIPSGVWVHLPKQCVHPDPPIARRCQRLTDNQYSHFLDCMNGVHASCQEPETFHVIQGAEVV